MITRSSCHTCCTGFLGKKDISVAQLWNMTDSQDEATSHIKMSNTMYVHKVVETYRTLQIEMRMYDGRTAYRTRQFVSSHHTVQTKHF